jgi:RimJ/RimL family protein N-acetyltransferase
MMRLIALLSLLATTGCVVYPYGAPYGGYGYGGYPYGYGYRAPVYAPAYRGQGYAPAATDYNPVSGSRTGSD